MLNLLPDISVMIKEQFLQSLNCRRDRSNQTTQTNTISYLIWCIIFSCAINCHTHEWLKKMKPKTITIITTRPVNFRHPKSFIYGERQLIIITFLYYSNSQAICGYHHTHHPINQNIGQILGEIIPWNAFIIQAITGGFHSIWN